jgi:hypothetical protein
MTSKTLCCDAKIRYNAFDETLVCSKCGIKITGTKEEYFELKIRADERRKLRGACEWKGNEENNYETSCGELYCIISGTPKENKMKYCCYCGKILKEMEG